MICLVVLCCLLIYLFVLAFIICGVLWASWICGLVSNINLEEFPVNIASNISSVHFSFSSLSGIPSIHTLHLLLLSHGFCIFCCVCVCVCVCVSSLLFSLLFPFWKFLLTHPYFQKFFSQPWPSYWYIHQRHSSFLLQCFNLFSSTSFSFFLGNLHLSAYIVHLFFHAVYFIH